MGMKPSLVHILLKYNERGESRLHLLLATPCTSRPIRPQHEGHEQASKACYHNPKNLLLRQSLLPAIHVEQRYTRRNGAIEAREQRHIEPNRERCVRGCGGRGTRVRCGRVRRQRGGVVVRREPEREGRSAVELHYLLRVRDKDGPVRGERPIEVRVGHAGVRNAALRNEGVDDCGYGGLVAYDVVGIGGRGVVTRCRWLDDGC